jgi:hypothetical protein
MVQGVQTYYGLFIGLGLVFVMYGSDPFNFRFSAAYKAGAYLAQMRLSLKESVRSTASNISVCCGA